MSQTTLRHIAMVRAVPRIPRPAVPTENIVAEVANAGFRVSRRTVERDLHKLAEPLGLLCETDEAGRNWWNRVSSLESSL